MIGEELKGMNISEMCDLLEMQSRIISEQSKMIEQLADMVIEMAKKDGAERWNKR